MDPSKQAVFQNLCPEFVKHYSRRGLVFDCSY